MLYRLTDHIGGGIMIDRRFYSISDPIDLEVVETITGAVLCDPKYKHVVVSGVAGLNDSTINDIVFFAQSTISKSLNHPELIDMLKNIKAGACLIDEKHKNIVPKDIPVLISKDPRGDFIKLQKYFYQDRSYSVKGIMDSAYIANSVEFVDKSSVFIGNSAVIEDNVKIGKNCYIGHNVVIKHGCHIGDNCCIKEGAVISHCIMGNYISIGEGTIIGSTGFGWHSGPSGHIRVPQIGRVVLEDFVEIDCNSCIDRGAIGVGTKIDNLVQIGHNNTIGKYCIFAGMSGVAGSSKIGNFVLLGAQSGVSGFLNIADYTQVAAQSGVVRNVDNTASKLRGTPAIDATNFARREILLRHMVEKKK